MTLAQPKTAEPRDVECPRCGTRVLRNVDAKGTVEAWCKGKGCKRAVNITLK